MLHRLLKPHFVYVYVVVFLTMFGSSLVISLQTNVWTGLFNDGDQCLTGSQTPACKHASGTVAIVKSVSMAVGAMFSFFLNPVMGRLSDNLGRRPLLIFTSVMSFLPPSAYALYQFFGVSLWLQIVLGCISSFTISPSVGLAYVADLVEPADRAVAFGGLLAATSVALIVGALVSTVLTQSTTFTFYWFVALFVLTFNVLVTPESLPEDKRQRNANAAERHQMLKGAVNPFVPLRILWRSPLFRRLAMCVLASSAALWGAFDVMYLYLKDKFAFSANDNAYVIVAFGITGLVVQGPLLRVLVKYLSNKTVYLIGLAFSVLSPLIYAVMWVVDLAYPATALLAVGMLTFPAVSAMKANNTHESEQGTIQGALYGVNAFGQAIGPLICGGLFSAFTSAGAPYFPQAPFIFCCAVAVAGLAIGVTIPKGTGPPAKPIGEDLTKLDQPPTPQPTVRDLTVNADHAPLLANTMGGSSTGAAVISSEGDVSPTSPAYGPAGNGGAGTAPDSAVRIGAAVSGVDPYASRASFASFRDPNVGSSSTAAAPVVVVVGNGHVEDL